jgi:hypothetical protein
VSFAFSQKDEQLASSKSNLEDALARIKAHEKLEAEVLRQSASLHRRFRAYVDDSKEVLRALSEALSRRELEPVLLLGSIGELIL